MAAATAAWVMAASPATPAAAATYTGTSTFQGATIDLSFTTDGTLGVLSAANITGWTVSAVVPATPSFVLTPGNSSLQFVGTALSATPTELRFDFDAAAPACFQVSDAPVFSAFWYVGANTGCGQPNLSREGVSSSVNGVLREPRSGLGVLGTAPAGGVPEPASWVMLIAGFGLTGALQRRRRPVAA